MSVGHRPELEAFHDRKLMLVRRQDGARLVADEELSSGALAIRRGLANLFRLSSAPEAEG